MRTATLTGIHNNERVLEEFFNVITISNRSTTGCAPSIGQVMTAELFRDKERFARYRQELAGWKKVITNRANAFLRNIDPEVVTPYKKRFLCLS